MEWLDSPQIAGRTNQPLVSVVMVVRNADRYLVEAIESILCQTFTDFEFVILDFGSTDRSKAIVSSYAARDNRIKLHETPDCGLGEARNAACSLAKGKYIAIQDADDISLPDRLLRQVEFMEKHSEIGLLGGAAEWIDGQGRHLWTLQFPTEDSEIRSALRIRCPFSQTAVLLRREAFIAVGGYRALFAPSEDYDLWLRISERFLCANLKQPVVKYRIHPHQVSLTRREQQTLCMVVARASAVFRKKGLPDPSDASNASIPELLSTLQVSEADLQKSRFGGYRNWISNMFAANECSLALQLAGEVLRSDWEHVERREIAYLYLILAKIHWRQRQFRETCVAACHAIRPSLAKDFGIRLLRRVWWKFFRARFRAPRQLREKSEKPRRVGVLSFPRDTGGQSPHF
jgi:glycosyltransferase involved in cell wall biosynthesis